MIPIEETGYSQYTGTGARQLFEYGFTVTEDTLVKVLVDGAVPVYTQQSNGVVITPAPILNAVVELYRYTDVTQLTDWVPFDSFNAEWTEDACDKLIMLKQEAWYRTFMNLASEHLLDRVILHNDKGTDAHLLIWNERDPLDDVIINEAGVFAGEVTDDMPEPGTYVLKPDDFAYFQWGAAPVFNQLLLTSTLYPIEIDDGIAFSGSLLAGNIREIKFDELAASVSFLTASLQEVVIDDGTTEDELAASVSFLTASLVTIVIDDGTTEDELSASVSLLSASLVPVLVTADTQESGLSFSGGIIAANMDDAP